MKNIDWEVFKVEPTHCRYVKFTATSFHGKGASLNMLQVYPAALTPTRPSHVVVDNVEEMERLEQVRASVCACMRARMFA